MTTTCTVHNCRACNQPMRADVQQLMRGGSTLLLTCWGDCSLKGFTFDLRGYKDVDLRDYNSAQHPDWQGAK